jgi:general secretion pathway protein A
MYFQLRPMSEEQTASYIVSRLKTAGNNSDSLFTPDACQRVFLISQGIPRLINVLCENALICCYAHEQRLVTPAMVDEIAVDLRLKLSVAQEAIGPNLAGPALEMAGALRSQSQPGGES